MRIIGGKFKGLALTSVGKGDAAAHLRPTSDRVRESIFNLLQNGGYGDPLTGARVLDLFAGTGALGLEALSRGAASVTFVDDGVKARSIIKSNIELCQANETTKLVARSAIRLGSNSSPAFDLVFLDPPYGKSLGEKALEYALGSNWIAPDALIVWEENAEKPAPTGLTKLDARRYGDTWVHILAA
ncbi:MAG: 16S rRNA (guanine966-N2)-methyltransferase [Paracoccaceae bacterium]|jgi:16S rRNA (guanine966-N2)-methyltransferase